MLPVSVYTLTTMSSTASTVRSAVLNGVLRGTRSMPSRTSVIFMMRGLVRSGPQALDAGDAVDGGGGAVGHHRLHRGHHHAIELQPHQLALRIRQPAHAG